MTSVDKALAILALLYVLYAAVALWHSQG